MAINLITNPSFAGRITGVSPDYPYGSSQNQTAPGAFDGTPWIEIRSNDIFGMQQSLLASAAIVPSGTADTSPVSQYVQAIVEIAAGRAITATEGASAANAYVVDVSTDQQAPQTLFDGLRVEAVLAAANTGAATLDAYGLGVKTITGSATVGIIVAGAKREFKFNAVSDEWEFTTQVIPDASETVKGIVEAATTAEMNAGTANKFPDAAKVKAYADSVSVPDASETVKGIVELATNAETNTGTDTTRAITPANLSNRTATETRTGIVELATTAEMNAGTANKFPDAAKVKAYADALLTRATAIATTSGTAHAFTGLDAGLNRITVMLDGVSLSANGDLLIQLGDAGGFETTGYVSGAGRGGTSTTSTTGFIITVSSVAVNAFSGVIIFTRIDGDTWVSNGNLDVNANVDPYVSAGTKTLTAELTQIQITRTGVGTFDLGKVNIFTE